MSSAAEAVTWLSFARLTGSNPRIRAALASSRRVIVVIVSGHRAIGNSA